MKNKLAENMLRFGPKNLTEFEKKNLSKLIEQASNAIESVILSKLGDRSTRIWNKMTPVEKQKILTSAEEKIQRHARIKGIEFDKSLSKIKEVRLGERPGETTKSETPPVTTVFEEIPYTATYPDNTKQNPELQNFYLKDNEIIVSADRKQKFLTMVLELKNLIPSNETIKEIHIKAGSSTSQVPTTYKGGTYNSIEEGQKNNISLANDRCAQIEAVLNEIIKTQFPQYNGRIIVDNRDIKPNNGPAYTSKERSYFFGSGKLDPNKKSEYDSKYGPYKGSYGSVMIITQGKTQTETETSEEQKIPQTNYYISISWRKPPKRKKKRFGKSKAGGGISVGGQPVLTDCPLW